MGELNFIILMPLSSLLFMLGGWHWKWMRRYLLPAILGLFAILNGSNILMSLIATSLLMIAFTLPYGSKSVPSYFGKFLVLSTYSLAITPLGISTLTYIFPFVATLTFWISNQEWGKKWMVWKIWEGLTGLLIGAMVSLLIA